MFLDLYSTFRRPDGVMLAKNLLYVALLVWPAITKICSVDCLAFFGFGIDSACGYASDARTALPSFRRKAFGPYLCQICDATCFPIKDALQGAFTSLRGAACLGHSSASEET